MVRWLVLLLSHKFICTRSFPICDFCCVLILPFHHLIADIWIVEITYNWHMEQLQCLCLSWCSWQSGRLRKPAFHGFRTADFWLGKRRKCRPPFRLSSTFLKWKIIKRNHSMYDCLFSRSVYYFNLIHIRIYFFRRPKYENCELRSSLFRIKKLHSHLTTIFWHHRNHIEHQRRKCSIQDWLEYPMACYCNRL